MGGTATVTHDAAGHITGDGTNTYSYSDRGRLVSATTPGGTVTYVYNGLNQRVGKSGNTTLVPTGAAYYMYDEAGQLLGEYDANGAPIYETIYLGQMPVGAMKQTGTAATSDIVVTLYNVHADHIATPRVITRQDQTIVWRWDSAEAFGATAPDQNPSSLGAFSFNQRFPGQVFDAETGLFQNWNREYNARLGRYVQSDPIGLAGGINTFSYVKGNPVGYVDPNGLYEIPIIDGFIRDFYTGKEVACLEEAKQQWVNWLRQTNNTPLSQMSPSDWYIQSQAPTEIAHLAIRQGGLIGGTAAKTTLVPSGITGKNPNPQLGTLLMGAGMLCGCK